MPFMCQFLHHPMITYTHTLLFITHMYEIILVAAEN